MGLRRKGGPGATICAWAFGLLLAVAVVEAVVPSLIERRIERAVESGFAEVDSTTARVRSFPAVKMLLGRFDRLDLVIRGAWTSDLRVDSIEVHSTGAQVALSRFAPGSLGWSHSLGNAQVAAVILDTDVNSYLKARDDALSLFSVSFEEGLVRLDGAITIAGLRVNVSSQGHLAIENRARLTYVVDKLSVERSQLPGFVLDMLEGMIELGIDLSALPLGIVWEGTRISAGSVGVFGTTAKGG